jgi:hypothetical protein
VENREYRGGHSDPDRERHDGDTGEARGAPEAAARIAGVADEVVQPAKPPRVAHRFLVCVDAAKAGDRCAPGLARRHTLALVFLRFHVEMEAHLLVQLALRVGRPEEVTHATHELGRSHHASPPDHVVRRMNSTALA